MTSQSKFLPKFLPMSWPDRRAYGVARVRDGAFSEIISLWRKRKADGMKQTELADRLGRDTGWLSKKLRGPGNWTLNTIGAMVEALDGEIEIRVYDINDRAAPTKNSTGYSGYDLQIPPPKGNTKLIPRTVTGSAVR